MITSVDNQTPATASGLPASDTPIDGINQADLLDREWFATQVAQRINAAGIGPSVVFGLSGDWGAGKTSALNLIKNALEDVDHDGWTVVFFTPWAVSDPYALAEEFYRTIASAMPKLQGAAVRTALNAAAPALAAGGKALLQGVFNRYAGEGTLQDIGKAFGDTAADKAGEFRIEEDPFAKRFKKIEEEIEKLDIRVLVVVDDIDRLHQDELLAVMKAVRLLGRFNGVHYLLSYDIQTVTDVLTRSDLAGGDPRRAERYLEKIVQYPFELPPIQLLHLRRVINDQLRELAARTGYALGEGTQHLDIILEQLPLDSLTLRTVHRLIAQTDIMLSLATDRKVSTSLPSDEIDLVDAVLLTYLRLEYPQLYRALRLWKRELTRREGSSIDTDEERDRADQWRTRVAKLVDPEAKDEYVTARAYTALRALFPESVPGDRKDYRTTPDAAPLQIRQSDYFDRYFAFGFPTNDLRDAAVRAELIHLISTGELPSNSLISAHVDKAETAQLLHTKIRTLLPPALDEITDVTHFGAAAITLTNAATKQERRQPTRHSWWAIASFHLWLEIEACKGPEQAKEAITTYLDEFGTEIAAIALDVGRDQIAPGTDLWAAAQPIRDRIHDEFVTALLDNDPEMQDPSPVARKWHWVYSWPSLREQIRDTIRHRTANIGLDLIGIATRLVTVNARPGSTSYYLVAFSIDDLKELVPEDEWPSDQIPKQMNPDIDMRDLSYTNRREFAANVIFTARQDIPNDDA